MLYVVIAMDRPDAGTKRADNRPAHLDFARGLGARLKAGGPFLGEDGERMIGSMLVLEAGSRAEVEALLKDDPYSKAGLFDSVDIRPWKWLLNAPEA